MKNDYLQIIVLKIKISMNPVVSSDFVDKPGSAGK